MKKITRLFQHRILLLILVSPLFVSVECKAQSVVGKWQRDFSRLFTIDQATGQQVFVSPEYQKQYDEATAKNGYKEILEMKSDHTYTSTVTAAGKQTAHSGTYSISGKTLDMNIPLVKGEKTNITIISLTDKSMIWNLVFMGKSNGVKYDKL